MPSRHEASLVTRVFQGAAVLGLSALAFTGCGTNGHGESIEKCNSNATDIAVTFAGDHGYKPETDPAILANFSAESRDFTVHDPTATGISKESDVADKVGEISCKLGEKVVFNTTGAKVQAYYLKVHPVTPNRP